MRAQVQCIGAQYWRRIDVGPQKVSAIEKYEYVKFEVHEWIKNLHKIY